MQVWLNGVLVSMEEARVSLFDAGIQHGVGVFTTMCFSNGRVFRLDQHLDRIKSSATELNLLAVLELAPLARAVAHTIASSGLTSGRLRLTITGGDMMLSASNARSGQVRHDPTIAIVAQPPTSYPDAIFRDGVRVRIADARLNQADPFAGHKTLWYWPRLKELQAAALAQCSESLYFNLSNRLVSGAVSNVFLVDEAGIRTPAIRGELRGSASDASAVLPGVTRSAIIEIAAAHGLKVEASPDMTVNELLSAREVFLTNSSWGVLPVTAVEATAIGSGTAGKVTALLRREYLDLVERATDSGQGWDDLAQEESQQNP